MNGMRLLPQHGFPLRLIVPGYYGMTNVKWLESIEIIDHNFNGVQMKSYAIKKHKGEVGFPVPKMVVRSLLVPPGIPDWFNRFRFVEEGDVLLEGRAWAGKNKIQKVEIGINGIYSEASLDEPVGKYAWRRFSYNWNALRGVYILSVKATDEKGNTQNENVWNFGGFCNNSIHTMKVSVKTSSELELGEEIDIKRELGIFRNSSTEHDILVKSPSRLLEEE